MSTADLLFAFIESHLDLVEEKHNLDMATIDTSFMPEYVNMSERGRCNVCLKAVFRHRINTTSVQKATLLIRGQTIIIMKNSAQMASAAAIAAEIAQKAEIIRLAELAAAEEAELALVAHVAAPSVQDEPAGIESAPAHEEPSVVVEEPAAAPEAKPTHEEAAAVAEAPIAEPEVAAVAESAADLSAEAPAAPTAEEPAAPAAEPVPAQ